jgi:thiamine-monophosphate kinase
MADAAAPAHTAEDRLIGRYFRPLATEPGALGLVDDAALLAPPPGHDLVLTADAVVGGVHFFPDDPPDAVARKALRVNLSDLAAKGARPAGFLLSLALPADAGEDWLAAFSAGLGADAEAYGCPLLGGDTVRTPGPAMIAISAFGVLPQGTMVRRSGARPGDHILVSGTIGDAALGLRLRGEAAPQWALPPAQRAHLAARYLLPQPRNAIAEAIRRHASAAMDVSDGLAGDLAKLCRASGVSADIELAHVPLSDAAGIALAGSPAVLETIVTGGDDYEVLCTVPPERAAELTAAAAAAGVPLTGIGRVTAGDGPPRFTDLHGRPVAFSRLSFSHF